MSFLARSPLVRAVLLSLVAATAEAGLPPEDTCPGPQVGAEDGVAEDAGQAPFKEGDVVRSGELGRIRSLLPDEVWQHRDVFFHEGMQMQIGSCHRRFAFPKFFTAATEANAGKATLDEDGNLSGYRAGLPFPPDTIDLAAPDAAARWAWNLVLRYRGAGPIGSFRFTDLPSRIGSVETYLGTFFWLQTGGRADLVSAASDDELGKSLWVAGGRFDEPMNARELAWRQIRRDDALEDYTESDDTFVYVPTMRKPRRAATAWVDGLYMPQYRVSGTDAGGGHLPIGSNAMSGPSGSIAPTAGLSIAGSEHIRRGLEGLVLRPNAYHWKWKGERDVLAPINSANPGYPENPDRNFGESGLSVASDRWDVRHAAVIEGVSKRNDEGEYGRVTVYVDWQTQQPLYWITRKANGLILDVGILVHRYSGDLPQYPEWPGGGSALVFDPVAASFFSVSEGRSGWRRESYDVRSVPVDDREVRRMSSTDSLLQGR